MRALADNIVPLPYTGRILVYQNKGWKSTGALRTREQDETICWPERERTRRALFYNSIFNFAWLVPTCCVRWQECARNSHGRAEGIRTQSHWRGFVISCAKEKLSGGIRISECVGIYMYSRSTIKAKVTRVTGMRFVMKIKKRIHIRPCTCVVVRHLPMLTGECSQLKW